MARSVFRSNNFYDTFLDWKTIPNSLQFDQCFSLNFDYYDMNLSIPQLAMTPESNMQLNYNSPIGCLLVMVGGKYLHRIGSVMEKVNSVTSDVGGRRPLAVFLISRNYKENMNIDVDYSFDRFKSTPVMVK